MLIATRAELGMTEHYKWCPRNKVELSSFAIVFETPLFIAAWHHWSELVDLLLQHGADLRAKSVRKSKLALKVADDRTVLTAFIKLRNWEATNLLLTSANKHLRHGIKPRPSNEMYDLLNRSPSRLSKGDMTNSSVAACYQVTTNLIKNFRHLGRHHLNYLLNDYVTTATSQGKNAVLRALLESGCSPNGGWSSLLTFAPLDYIRIHQKQGHGCETGCSFLDCAFYIGKFESHRRGLQSSLEVHLLLNVLAAACTLAMIPVTYYTFIEINKWHIPFMVQSGRDIAGYTGAWQYVYTWIVWLSFIAYIGPLISGYIFFGVIIKANILGNGLSLIFRSRARRHQALAALLFPFLGQVYKQGTLVDATNENMDKRTVKSDWEFLHFWSVDLLVYIISLGRISRFDKVEPSW